MKRIEDELWFKVWRVVLIVYVVSAAGYALLYFRPTQRLWFETESAKIDATFWPGMYPNTRPITDRGPRQYKCPPCTYIDAERRYVCDCTKPERIK